MVLASAWKCEASRVPVIIGARPPPRSCLAATGEMPLAVAASTAQALRHEWPGETRRRRQGAVPNASEKATDIAGRKTHDRVHGGVVEGRKRSAPELPATELVPFGVAQDADVAAPGCAMKSAEHVRLGRLTQRRHREGGRVHRDDQDVGGRPGRTTAS